MPGGPGTPDKPNQPGPPAPHRRYGPTVIQLRGSMFVRRCWAVVPRSSFLLRRDVAIRSTRATIIQTGRMAEQGSAFPDEFAAAAPIKSMRLSPHSRRRGAVIGSVAAVKDGMKKQPQRCRAAVQRIPANADQPRGCFGFGNLCLMPHQNPACWASSLGRTDVRQGDLEMMMMMMVAAVCSIHHIHPSIPGRIHLLGEMDPRWIATERREKALSALSTTNQPHLHAACH